MIKVVEDVTYIWEDGAETEVKLADMVKTYMGLANAHAEYTRMLGFLKNFFSQENRHLLDPQYENNILYSNNLELKTGLRSDIMESGLRIPLGRTENFECQILKLHRDGKIPNHVHTTGSEIEIVTSGRIITNGITVHRGFVTTTKSKHGVSSERWYYCDTASPAYILNISIPKWMEGPEVVILH